MTGGFPKILGIDARAYATIPIVLLIQGWSLLFLQIAVLIIMFVLNRKGYTFEVFYLYIRRTIGGRKITPFPTSYIQKHDESY